MEEFVFDLGTYSEDLTAEVESVLRAELERRSRSRLPKLWSVTDRLNQTHDHGAAKSKPLFVVIIQEIILFAAGFFLIVPGISQQNRFNAMTVFGALLILIATARLLPKAGSSTEKKIKGSAAALIQSLNRIDPKEKPKVTVREDDVQISSKSGERCMSFEKMDAAYETQRLFVFVSSSSATVVQKNNLKVGDSSSLSAFLLATMAQKFKKIEK